MAWRSFPTHVFRNVQWNSKSITITAGGATQNSAPGTAPPAPKPLGLTVQIVDIGSWNPTTNFVFHRPMSFPPQIMVEGQGSLQIDELAGVPNENPNSTFVVTVAPESHDVVILPEIPPGPFETELAAQQWIAEFRRKYPSFAGVPFVITEYPPGSTQSFTSANGDGTIVVNIGQFKAYRPFAKVMTIVFKSAADTGGYSITTPTDARQILVGRYVENDVADYRPTGVTWTVDLETYKVSGPGTNPNPSP